MSIKAGRVFAALALTLVLSASLMAVVANAAPYEKLSTRSLRIGDSRPGATTDYLISLSWPVSTSIGSVRFLLCEDYLVEEPCAVVPDGDMSAAVLSGQTGLGGFSIDSQAAGEILIARGSAAMTGTGMHSFTFDDVVNPSTIYNRFYIQIFTYSSIDGTGIPTHMSSVATSTAEPIMINTEVPPILYFCAALTITEWCNSVSGNHIDYGDLSPLAEDSGISQFGAATNAAGGYVVTANGNTMAAGNNLIDALNIPAPNTPGTAQFGMNLRANTNPANGQDVIGAGIGVVAADYDTPDVFKYQDGDIVATSATGTVFNTYTVTYIVNVPPDQPSGIYNTTITYICTAAF